MPNGRSHAGRRDFLRDAFRVLILLPLVSGFGIVINYLRPLQKRPSRSGPVVDAEGRPIRMDEVAEGEVRMGYLGEDVVLIMREGTAFRAWSAVCTHMACTVRWLAGERQFACHCHGARFNEKGDVARGPATAPLQRMGVRVRDGKFYGA